MIPPSPPWGGHINNDADVDTPGGGYINTSVGIDIPPVAQPLRASAGWLAGWLGSWACCAGRWAARLPPSQPAGLAVYLPAWLAG